MGTTTNKSASLQRTEIDLAGARSELQHFDAEGRVPHDCPPPWARLPDTLDEIENGPAGTIEPAGEAVDFSREARMRRLFGSGRKPRPQKIRREGA
jgi:hypothetical protein